MESILFFIFSMAVTAIFVRQLLISSCDRYKAKVNLAAKQRLFDEALLAEMPDTGYLYLLALANRLGLNHDNDKAKVELIRNAIKEAANDLRRGGDAFLEGRAEIIKELNKE